MGWIIGGIVALAVIGHFIGGGDSRPGRNTGGSSSGNSRKKSRYNLPKAE